MLLPQTPMICFVRPIMPTYSAPEFLRHRRTKIVATLGPASSSQDVIERLIEAGVNVFRMNMSHGTQETHRATYEALRVAARAKAATIAVFADLCGPKIRVGTFAGGAVKLETGSHVTVTTRDVVGAPGLIPSQYAELAKDVAPGSRILLDDGNLTIVVEAVDGTEIRCRVVDGGVLKDHKGMNLPGVRVSVSSVTAKDKADARFAAQLGVDFVALSFVRTRGDVDELRGWLRELGRDVPIISKIEKPEALDHIDGILEASDAIMIARGDLGVELPPEQVPGIQEQLVDLGRVHHRPVIVATQMLESMVVNPRPTRAEVTDVANAVRSGTDAVMLSAETAAGAHPIEAVRMMDTIIRQTEASLFKQGGFAEIDLYTPTQPKLSPPVPVEAAVAQAAALLSRELLVRGIIVLSRSGRSIEVMSAARPAAPLIGVSSDPDATSFGCLLWGVVPVTIADWEHQDAQPLAVRMAERFRLGASEPSSILLVRAFHADPMRNTPTITVVALPAAPSGR